MSAAEGQEIAQDVIMTLEKNRNENSFDPFWERVEQRRQQLSIPTARLPRKWQLLDFFGSTNKPSTQHHDTSIKDRYRRYFFEAYDNTIQGIKNRLSQGDVKWYSTLQQLVLKAANGESYEEEFNHVTTFYKNYIKKSLLETQLPTVKISLRSQKKMNISEVLEKFRSLSPARKNLLSEVIKVVRLLLVMPATNAISERSFSSLKRVKT